MNDGSAADVISAAELLAGPAVEVRELTKTYAGGVEAVRGIDFQVAAGEVFGILGPNGAGKSTTIGMLTTTIAPTSGCARLGGFDVVRRPLDARSISSVVFQEPVVDRGLTGRANLELHGRLWGVQPVLAAARIAELADAVGLTEILDRAVDTYSGGQRRRLEIARALVSSPRVLFLDEPTVGLDPRIRLELLDAIAALREREEMTIVLTTHYLDEAERLCDRVAIMHSGEIVALDTPNALLAGLGHEVLELRIHGDTSVALAALGAHGVAAAEAFVVGSTLTVPLHDATAVEAIAAINQAGIGTSSISTRQPTLDDVYLRLTGASLAAAA
jgi:ABC-2 type transport system ATP-binding protein